MHGTCVALAASLALATTAVAQGAGTFEIGAFPHVSYFDRSLNLDQGQAGPGGRLGIFFARNFEVEGEAAWVPVDGLGDVEVSYIPIRGRLTYNLPVGEHGALLLGAGYVRAMYRKDADVDDDGATGLIGARLGLGERLSIRLDSYVDFIPSPSNGDAENWNFGFMPGLAVLLGGGGPRVRDSDRDGVPDEADRCADTPAGEQVDAQGCPPPKDADRDGVPDDRDQCADTPAGDRVDQRGCSLPKDDDADRVGNDADRCPGTPAGEQVDANGCSAGQRDSDGDGVNDTADKCADTPAGTQVDANGCPVPKDTDGDGVTDDRDRCPSTAKGVQVDANGCQVLFEGKRTALVLRGVTFETGKATLTPESQEILLGVAQSLVANDTIRVEVQGHTDSRGTRALNQRLSQARADAVRQFLIQNGVPGDRLVAKGYGPDQPVASNRTAAGRAQNRRVELKKLP